MKLSPLLDGRRIVRICDNPELHTNWRLTLITTAGVMFVAGMFVGRFLMH